jgi:hypothetical protein
MAKPRVQHLTRKDILNRPLFGRFGGNEFSAPLLKIRKFNKPTAEIPC